MKTVMTYQDSNGSTTQDVDHCQSKLNTIDNSSLLSFRTKIVWSNVISFIILHIAGVYGIYRTLFFQVKFLTTVYSILIADVIGFCVSAGAHRMWSHRSFKATFILKIVLLIGQTSSGQNSVWQWVRDHRLHHKYSDTDADPHNSRRGFFFSHMGWLMMKKHPEVIKKGKTIDMTDIIADPLLMFQKRHYKLLYLIFGFLIPTFIPFLWDETLTNAVLAHFGRYVAILNMTWCVNSVAHFFGNKPYTKGIPPVESSFTSFLTSGEGWHNYHHTFPWDYKAAELGMHLNLNAKLIDWFAYWGLAHDLKSATPEMVARRIASQGDGSHHSLIKKQNQSTKNEKIKLLF